MNTFEKFQRLVIEKLHGKPYEEAMYAEEFLVECETCRGCGTCYECEDNRGKIIKYGLPITLDRVLKALDNTSSTRCFGVLGNAVVSELQSDGKRIEVAYVCDWKLTKDDGFTPATHLDQSEECLLKLIDLLEQ